MVDLTFLVCYNKASKVKIYFFEVYVLTKSIRKKLFALLTIIGAVPFILVIIVGAINMTSELEDAAVKSGTLKNAIISEHVTESIEKNFYVLHSLALNPMIINYLKSPSDEQHETVSKILQSNNDDVFKDPNLMALTNGEANQLIRTDHSKLVNIAKRRHFQEAMQGRDFVSDVILSMSTGEMIIVLEVAVKDELQKPIGMLQRNINLKALQQFVETQDDEEISVIIIDREGKIIAYSDKIMDFAAEHEGEGSYKFITEEINDNIGNIRTNINGEDTLVCYSRNLLTDWVIITVQPYHYILDQVYEKIAKAVIVGLLMLLFVSVTAYLLSIKVTKPIIEIRNAADKIVKGTGSFDKIEISSDDELGAMAEAFNKIRSARDAYQLESELDSLTKLYNKSTTENICKMKLKNFNENENNDTWLAVYIIDLDHFKEINDNFGHQFGDKVLIEFSKVIRKQFRPNDCIGRFGGDEFIVVLDNLPNDIEIIKHKAVQIQKATRNIYIDGQSAGVTASIGIAIAPEDGKDYETLFKIADESLYLVKNGGRDGYCYDQNKVIH